MITKIRLQNWKSFKDSTIYIDSLGILIRRGEDFFCIEIEIEIDGSSYLLDLRVIKRNSVFSFGSCEIHRLGIEDDDVVPGKFIDSARNITWKMYDVPVSLDFWAKIYATFRNIIILDPVPAKMRDYCKISKELKSDGSNVAGVLCALAPEEKKKVEALVSSYVRPLPERDINKVISEPVGLIKSDAMLYCYEDWNPEQPVDARGMSDGTLRFIAIVVALLTVAPHSLLLIEEVDNGLHPSRAKELVDMLKELSRQRQVDVLCTTHNPVLLDELGNKMIPFISYVTRDENGDSHVNLLEEKENLAKLMASGTIGRMMVNDKIQSSLWNPENLKKLAEKWKATVIGGQALGDASIVEVVKYYTDLGYEVEIFTGDEGLKAYEPTVEIPRRRRK